MIKYLIMDVDGTLTDGKIYIGSSGELMKAFNIKDGYSIAVMLPRYNIEPIIITGRTSEIVKQRCDELRIKKVFQGVGDKLKILKDVLCIMDLSECAYIGDDLIDLDVMKEIKNQGGVIGCPADAILDVKNISHFVSDKNGGEGCVRDFIDWIISSK